MNAIVNAAMAGSIGVLSIAMAIAFKRGRARRLAFAYWDPTIPWYIRNAVFGFAPTGVAALAAAVIGLAGTTDTLTGAFVALPFILSLGPVFLLVILWARRPPDFLKPDWLRAEEAVRGGQPSTTGAARWIDRTALLLGIVAAAIVALGFPFLLLYRP